MIHRVLKVTYPASLSNPSIKHTEAEKENESLQKCCSSLPSPSYHLKEEVSSRALYKALKSFPRIQSYFFTTFPKNPHYPKATEHADGSGDDPSLQIAGAASTCILCLSLQPRLKLILLMWLVDIYVIISVLHIRTYSLSYLTDHRYKDIPP